MPIRVNTPVTVVLRFRHWDESNTDLGPLDLTDPEHLPIVVKAKKPGVIGSTTIDAGTITITDAANGLVEWEAAAGVIDAAGNWQVQGWAGNYPSNIVAFPVAGPNL